MAPPKRRRMSLKEEALLLPNILTYMRIAVIPFVAWLMYVDSLGARFAAILLYTAAAITDYFDGYLARKRGLVSTVGKFLDPLADKLLVITILLILMWSHIVPGWIIIIIIGRVAAPDNAPGTCGQSLAHIHQAGFLASGTDIFVYLAVFRSHKRS